MSSLQKITDEPDGSGPMKAMLSENRFTFAEALTQVEDSASYFKPTELKIYDATEAHYESHNTTITYNKISVENNEKKTIISPDGIQFMTQNEVATLTPSTVNQVEQLLNKRVVEEMDKGQLFLSYNKTRNTFDDVTLPSYIASDKIKFDDGKFFLDGTSLDEVCKVKEKFSDFREAEDIRYDTYRTVVYNTGSGKLEYTNAEGGMDLPGYIKKDGIDFGGNTPVIDGAFATAADAVSRRFVGFTEKPLDGSTDKIVTVDLAGVLRYSDLPSSTTLPDYIKKGEIDFGGGTPIIDGLFAATANNAGKRFAGFGEKLWDGSSDKIVTVDRVSGLLKYSDLPPTPTPELPDYIKKDGLDFGKNAQGKPVAIVDSNWVEKANGVTERFDGFGEKPWDPSGDKIVTVDRSTGGLKFSNLPPAPTPELPDYIKNDGLDFGKDSQGSSELVVNPQFVEKASGVTKRFENFVNHAWDDKQDKIVTVDRVTGGLMFSDLPPGPDLPDYIKKDEIDFGKDVSSINGPWIKTMDRISGRFGDFVERPWDGKLDKVVTVDRSTGDLKFSDLPQGTELPDYVKKEGLKFDGTKVVIDSDFAETVGVVAGRFDTFEEKVLDNDKVVVVDRLTGKLKFAELPNDDAKLPAYLQNESIFFRGGTYINKDSIVFGLRDESRMGEECVTQISDELLIMGVKNQDISVYKDKIQFKGVDGKTSSIQKMHVEDIECLTAKVDLTDKLIDDIPSSYKTLLYDTHTKGYGYVDIPVDNGGSDVPDYVCQDGLVFSSGQNIQFDTDTDNEPISFTMDICKDVASLNAKKDLTAGDTNGFKSVIYNPSTKEYGYVGGEDGSDVNISLGHEVKFEASSGDVDGTSSFGIKESREVTKLFNKSSFDGQTNPNHKVMMFDTGTGKYGYGGIIPDYVHSNGITFSNSTGIGSKGVTIGAEGTLNFSDPDETITMSRKELADLLRILTKEDFTSGEVPDRCKMLVYDPLNLSYGFAPIPKPKGRIIINNGGTFIADGSNVSINGLFRLKENGFYSDVFASVTVKSELCPIYTVSHYGKTNNGGLCTIYIKNIINNNDGTWKFTFASTDPLWTNSLIEEQEKWPIPEPWVTLDGPINLTFFGFDT